MWMAALLLGLAGSFHCAGMCSPLIMAVTGIRHPFFVRKVIYNTGRIFSYMILGALATGLGSHFQFNGFQDVLSVVLGFVLIILGVSGASRFRIPVVTSLILRFTSILKRAFGKLLTHKNNGSMFLMGTLNGILPCGLTYLALSFCFILQAPIDGATFMLLFGAGTLPVMLGFTSLLHVSLKRFNLSWKRLTTTLLIITGILLVARAFIPHQHMDDAVNKTELSGDVIICD